jgi:hypothetical protein
VPSFYPLKTRQAVCPSGKASALKEGVCAIAGMGNDLEDRTLPLPPPFALWRIELLAGKSYIAKATAFRFAFSATGVITRETSIKFLPGGGRPPGAPAL